MNLRGVHLLHSITNISLTFDMFSYFPLDITYSIFICAVIKFGIHVIYSKIHHVLVLFTTTNRDHRTTKRSNYLALQLSMLKLYITYPYLSFLNEDGV